MSLIRVTPIRALSPKHGGLKVAYGDGGNVLDAGHTTGPTLVPFAHTLKSWYFDGDNIGSLVIAVWASAVNNPPVIGDNIAGSNPISLSTLRSRSDLILSGWTVAMPANTRYLITVVSCSGIRRGDLTLNWERT